MVSSRPAPFRFASRSVSIRAVAAVLPLFAAGAARAQPLSEATEPVVGLPCEGCEAVFAGLPAQLFPTARIAPAGEPGEPLRITGRAYDAAGRPSPV